MEKIEIKSIGFDSFDREVFQTAQGSFCSAMSNLTTHTRI